MHRCAFKTPNRIDLTALFANPRAFVAPKKVALLALPSLTHARTNLATLDSSAAAL